MKKIIIVVAASVFISCSTNNKPVEEQAPVSTADEIKLSAQQIRLGNIQVDTIRNGMLGDKMIFAATLNIDPARTASMSSRIMGRIETLYFKTVGNYIHKGDRVLDIYSEELNNAKQEYLLAIERKTAFEGHSAIDFNQLIESAKNKLMLWGMTEAQIDELAGSKTATPVTSVYSSVNGYITSLDVKEGDYIMEGGTLYTVADLSTLWAEAQIYASQLSALGNNALAEISMPDLPGKIFSGRIEFSNPEISQASRINLVRIQITNSGNMLKPGMAAYVTIRSGQHNMLSLPIDAVLRDGKGATVWVQTGGNAFKSKMVVTGIESDERIEIRSGLREGDVVVINGAYLINSEYIFRKGTSPMSGHDMSNM